MSMLPVKMFVCFAELNIPCFKAADLKTWHLIPSQCKIDHMENCFCKILLLPVKRKYCVTRHKNIKILREKKSAYTE